MKLSREFLEGLMIGGGIWFGYIGLLLFIKTGSWLILFPHVVGSAFCWLIVIALRKRGERR